MSLTCEVLFNNISQGTIEIHPGEYPDEAAKFMMLQTETKKCKHVTILCEAINARYELYDCCFDIFGSFIRTIYGYDLRPPYNQGDGMKVFNQHRMQCDHKATLKHRTCFRPFYEYIYDQRGVPILAFCEKHYPKGA